MSEFIRIVDIGQYIAQHKHTIVANASRLNFPLLRVDPLIEIEKSERNINLLLNDISAFMQYHQIENIADLGTNVFYDVAIIAFAQRILGVFGKDEKIN